MRSVGFDIERATRASPSKKGAVQALHEGHPFPFPLPLPFHLFRTLLTAAYMMLHLHPYPDSPYILTFLDLFFFLLSLCFVLFWLHLFYG
jgi:hypothetical protein